MPRTCRNVLALSMIAGLVLGGSALAEPSTERTVVTAVADIQADRVLIRWIVGDSLPGGSFIVRIPE